MTRWVSLGIFCVLTMIAGFHVYWGIGGLWPAHSEQELVNMVIGEPNFAGMPPPWLTLTVAAFIFFAGLVALARARILSLPLAGLWLVGAYVLAFVFLLRAAWGFARALDFWPTSLPLSEPFATLDWQAYSPLCTLIGGGFLLLAMRPTGEK